jgi:hypothetical protein
MNPRPFSEGRLPPSFLPTATTVEWAIAVPSGYLGKNESVVYAGKSDRGGQLLITAVRNREYPAGYWTSFLDSSAYQHSIYRGRLVIYVTNQTSVLAMSKIGNYIVTVNGLGQSIRNVIKFAQRLRFVS